MLFVKKLLSISIIYYTFLKFILCGPFLSKFAIFILFLLITRRKKKSHTTILIFGGIDIEEAIFTSTASAKPTAIGRVGEIKKAKYNLKRAVPI